MIQNFKRKIALLSLFFLVFSLSAPLFAVSINLTEKYAWSDSVGWINFNPGSGSVDVTDTVITGSAWSDNFGWINLQPTKSGVDNIVVDDPILGCIGDLSGSAWNTNLGWLDFENIYIDNNGDFQGTSTGSSYGTINFQGINYGVNTLWRPDCLAPSTGNITLDSISDTGLSSLDNLISQTLPSFQVSCSEVNSTIRVYSGTGIIATQTCTSTGTTLVPSTVVLSEGLHSISYTETDQIGNISSLSNPLLLTLDTTLPSINITAPTKLSNSSILDTTFTLSDSLGIDISSIALGTGSLNTSSLVCSPSTGTGIVVNCSVSIDTSGDFSVSVKDVVGNMRTVFETLYVVDTLPPNIPSVSVNLSSGPNNPTLTFSSLDNIAVARYDIIYFADDGGVGSGVSTTINGASSPVSLSLDPDELTHTVTVRVYDTAGNSSENIVKFPVIVDFSSPTPISNTIINNSSVTLTSPDGSPITSIALNAGVTGASLGTCTGNASDISDPYDSPVVCQISNITNSGNIEISAVDSVTGVQGQNTQSYIIETQAPSISILAPTKFSRTSIGDTSITIIDDTAVSASSVSISSSSTASFSSLTCVQTSPTRVDCSISIDSSGDIEVGVSDTAGNTANRSELSYNIDMILPTVSLDLPPAANNLNQNIYPLSGTCTIGDGNVTVFVGGANPETQSIVCNTSGTWSVLTNVSLLPDAQDIITIYASQTDLAGNIESTLPFLGDKDTQAPSIINPNMNPLQIPQGSNTLQAVSCTDTQTSCTITQTGSFDINTLGNYTVSYIAIDEAGNTQTLLQTLQVVPRPYIGGGGTGIGKVKDICPTGDTSGDIYDGICENVINTLPPVVIIEEEKGAEEDLKNIPEKEIGEEKEIEEEKIIKTAEKDGYMQIEREGKLIGYTLENTYESCPIIDAINDEQYAYEIEVFSDIELSPYKKTIEKFKSLQLVHGNSLGFFEPAREISRAEFTKLVLLSHCYTYDQEDTSYPIFSDLIGNTWEARVVQKAKILGIIDGYDDGTFKSSQTITKAEATKILMKMAFIQVNQLESIEYIDVSIEWQKKYIQIGQTLGVFDVQRDNALFKPDDGVIREEMVDLIERIVKLYR